MINFLKCLVYGLHDYKMEPQKVVGLRPMFSPVMGVREVVQYMPVCQRCGEMHPWSIGQQKLGSWVSGGPSQAELYSETHSS